MIDLVDVPTDTPPSLANRAIYFNRSLAELRAELVGAAPIARPYLRRRIRETVARLEDVERAVSAKRPRKREVSRW